jgi:hypothetical protein
MTTEAAQERVYLYSVLRYVPRPKRGEFINLGVVAVDSDGTDVAFEVTSDWRRARLLGRNEDIQMLQKLAREWKKRLRSPSEQLFSIDRASAEWLETMQARSANVIQLSEPFRALAASAAALARETFDDLVGTAAKQARGPATSKRGVQLALEGELRRRGFGDAYERGYVAAGADVEDWTFDYAVKNGRPLHFIQTLSFKRPDTRAILADATYAAYAQRDLRRGDNYADVPISVVAEAPTEDDHVVHEARSILAHQAVDLVLRDSLPDFVTRLQAVATTQT